MREMGPSFVTVAAQGFYRSRVRNCYPLPKIPRSERIAGFLFLLPLFVHFSPAGTAQKIVYADLIKVSQSAENMRRNHPLPAFVIGVCPLRDVDCGTHLGLRQISIFPEITNSLISTHNHHRKKYSSEQFVLLTF